jgi:hypothetical protein
MFYKLAPRAEAMGATNPQLPYKTALIVIVFLALAVSHALKVFIKIFRRFKSYRGVYFYSLLVATVGIIIHAIGYFVRNYGISNSAPLEITLVCGGGMMMITGQSIVLWSRLHLISPGRRDSCRLHRRARRGHDTSRRFELSKPKTMARDLRELGDFPGDLVRLSGMPYQWPVHLSHVRAYAQLSRIQKHRHEAPAKAFDTGQYLRDRA